MRSPTVINGGQSTGCINETMQCRNLTTLESNGTIKLVIKPIHEHSNGGQNMVNVHGKGGVLLSGNKTIYTFCSMLVCGTIPYYATYTNTV